MKPSHSVIKLSKFLVYILGRQPDEFGLLTDADGYVKIKDLMKALAEEPGWRHVRLNQIREVVHTTRLPTIEIQENRIRAVDRTHLLLPEIPDTIPKLLYYPVRRRAHPFISERGLRASAHGERIVLAENLQLAQRLGRRIDPAAVILTVNTNHARKQGATVWCFGRHLFLFDRLPLGCFSGPPLPKKRPVSEKGPAAKPEASPKTPGSYLLDWTAQPPRRNRSEKGSRRRKNEWKRGRKHKSKTRTFF